MKIRALYLALQLPFLRSFKQFQSHSAPSQTYTQWRNPLFTEPQYSYDHLDKNNYEKMKKIIQGQHSPPRSYMPYRKTTNTSQNAQIRKIDGHSNNDSRFLEYFPKESKNELFKEMVSLNKQIMENIQQQISEDDEEPLIINITIPYKYSKNDGITGAMRASNEPIFRSSAKENGFLDENGIFRYNRPSKKRWVSRNNKKEWENEDDAIGDEEDDEYTTHQQTRTSSNDFSNENNFQVIKQTTHTFKHIGGYENIKKELLQISDILLNYPKYKKYNVRTPKGLILDGPPGNGKTLIAKCFSGEINIPFIQCSGAEFSEKYVGVGASRIRELFDLAEKNKPCIIFIDEIDALARKRGNDMVNSNSEKDQTLNQLLVCMDGFKELTGVFVIGATNRVDMLDEAILRPGRMDKHIYIGNPDKNTRGEIIKIHLKGKQIDENIQQDYLIELTSGFSGSQIENLLNEAMLKSLRENRVRISMDDLEQTANRIISGFQGLENKYSPEMIHRIIIHELGHAIIGLFSKEHPKLTKVCINLWSPKTPGYTIFETTDEDNNIHTKEGLLAHLTVLFSGRIAEEYFYGDSITTGARQDLEQAYNLANDMILKYGMGKQNVYPYISDKYKHIIDEEINELLLIAAIESRKIIANSKNLILDCCEILKRENKLFTDQIVEIVDTKYPYLWDLYKTQSLYK